MKYLYLSEKNLDRIQRLLDRLRLTQDAIRLSDVIDAELARPGTSEDPTVRAISMASTVRQLPADFVQRSWRCLENDVFGNAPTRRLGIGPDIIRRTPTFWTAILRRPLIVALALCTVLATATAWMAGPCLSGRTVIARSLGAWGHVQSFRASMQFLSFVPGHQMNWSGVQTWQAPDHAVLKVTGATGHLTASVTTGRDSISKGPQTAADTEVGFLTMQTRMGPLLRQAANASGCRSEGPDVILGHRCRVVYAWLSRGSWGMFQNGVSPMRSITAERLWISDRTQLPVQVDTYFSDGSLASEYRFIRFIPNVRL